MSESDLSEIPTQELILEIIRRSNAIILMLDLPDDGNVVHTHAYCVGHPMTCLGMAHSAVLISNQRIKVTE